MILRYIVLVFAASVSGSSYEENACQSVYEDTALQCLVQVDRKCTVAMKTQCFFHNYRFLAAFGGVLVILWERIHRFLLLLIPIFFMYGLYCAILKFLYSRVPENRHTMFVIAWTFGVPMVCLAIAKLQVPLMWLPILLVEKLSWFPYLSYIDYNVAGGLKKAQFEQLARCVEPDFQQAVQQGSVHPLQNPKGVALEEWTYDNLDKQICKERVMPMDDLEEQRVNSCIEKVIACEYVASGDDSNKVYGRTTYDRAWTMLFRLAAAMGVTDDWYFSAKKKNDFDRVDPSNVDITLRVVADGSTVTQAQFDARVLRTVAYNDTYRFAIFCHVLYLEILVLKKQKEVDMEAVLARQAAVEEILQDHVPGGEPKEKSCSGSKHPEPAAHVPAAPKPAPVTRLTDAELARLNPQVESESTEIEASGPEELGDPPKKQQPPTSFAQEGPDSSKSKSEKLTFDGIMLKYRRSWLGRMESNFDRIVSNFDLLTIWTISSTGIGSTFYKFMCVVSESPDAGMTDLQNWSPDLALDIVLLTPVMVATIWGIVKLMMLSSSLKQSLLNYVESPSPFITPVSIMFFSTLLSKLVPSSSNSNLDRASWWIITILAYTICGSLYFVMSYMIMKSQKIRSPLTFAIYDTLCQTSVQIFSKWYPDFYGIAYMYYARVIRDYRVKEEQIYAEEVLDALPNKKRVIRRKKRKPRNVIQHDVKQLQQMLKQLDKDKAGVDFHLAGLMLF